MRPSFELRRRLSNGIRGPTNGLLALIRALQVEISVYSTMLINEQSVDEFYAWCINIQGLRTPTERRGWRASNVQPLWRNAPEVSGSQIVCGKVLDKPIL
jgi:hypothetical protein